MQRYDVMIRCTAQRLPIILQALDGAMELVSVKPAEGELPRVKQQQPGRRKNMGYAGGKRDKGISGSELMVELLTAAGGSMSYDKLSRAFMTRGFAPNSASPILSQMRKVGIVEMPQRGTWRLAKKAAAA